MRVIWKRRPLRILNCLGLDAIICIGGDDTLGVATKFLKRA